MNFDVIFDIAEKGAKGVIISIDDIVNSVENALDKVTEIGSTFESTFAKVETLAGDTADSLENLSNSILKLSGDLGVSASELNEAVYQSLSASVSTADVIDFVETARKASVAGFTDATTAVDGLTSVINAYGFSVDQADSLANKFLVTQNKGKTTFDEIAKSIGKVAPVAAQTGVSLDDLLAGIATLTAQGIATPEAVTAIKAALSNIIKPSSDAAKAAEELGISFDAVTLKEKGFAEFLNYVSDAAGGDAEVMARLFGSVEALNGVLSLTSEEGMKKVSDASAALVNDTDTLENAFDTMSSTLSFKVDEMAVLAENLGIVIFDKFSESLKSSVDSANSILSGITLVFDDPEVSGAISQFGQEISDTFNEIIESGFDADSLKVVITSIINILSEINTAISPLLKIVTSFVTDVLSGLGSVINSLHDSHEGVLGLSAAFAIVLASSTGLFSYIDEGLNAVKTGVTKVIEIFMQLKDANLSLSTVMFDLYDGAAGIGSALISSFTGALPAILAATVAIVAVVAAITAISDSIAQYKEDMKAFKESYEYVDEFNEKLNDIADSYENITAAAEEHRKATESNINGVETLWEELQGYVDEQGNVIDNQERVNALVSILNNDYGQTITLQNGMIKNYAEMKNSVEDYIASARKEAELEFLKPQYQEAIGNKVEAEEAIKQQEASLKAMVERRKEIENELDKTSTFIWDTLKRVELESQLKVLNEKISDTAASIDSASMTVGEYETVIAEYESKIVEAVEEGSTGVSESTIDTLAEANSEIIKNQTTTVEALKKIQSDYLKDRQRALDDAYDAEKARRDKELALLKQDNEDAYKEQERIWSNAEYVRKKAYSADLENLKNTNNKLIDERKKYLDTDYNNFKREKDDEYTLQERNAKDLIDSEIQIAEARIDSVKKYFDNKKKLEDKSYNETIKRLEAQKNAELGIIDAEAEARKRKQKEDEISRIESELAQYGDVDKLLTSADIKAYKELEQKLIDKRNELEEYDYEQDLKKRKENAEEKYKIEKEAEEKRHKEELERISERSTSQIDSLKAALEQNKTEWSRSLEDNKTAWKRAQEDELQALKDKNVASLEDYKATLKAQEDALNEENAALIEIFKIHLDDEKTEYKRMQQEKYDEAKEINEDYLKDLKRQNSDVIDEIKDKQSEALKLFKENANTLTDPNTGFLVVLNNQADTLTESIDDSASAVDNLATSFNNVLTEVDNVKDSLGIVDKMLSEGFDITKTTWGDALITGQPALPNSFNQGNAIWQTTPIMLSTLNQPAQTTQPSVTQHINFNLPVTSPDLVASDIRNATTYGLNSANRR